MPESAAPQATVVSKPFSVEIHTSAKISASVTSVWTALMDTAAYPDWSPFIRSIQGPIAEDRHIDVVLQVDGRKPQKLRPKIVAFEPQRWFEWLGRMGPPGVLDARHRFEIRSNGDTGCEIVHSERLSGMLVPLVRSLLTGPIPEAFMAHNLALKSKLDHGP